MMSGLETNAPSHLMFKFGKRWMWNKLKFVGVSKMDAWWQL